MSRGQAAPRAAETAASHGRGGGAGFANVLASVQEDDDPGRGVRSRRAADAEATLGSETPVHEVSAVPADVPVVQTQTPWLLHAFGCGTVARGGGGETADADSRELSTETIPLTASGAAAPPEARPDQMSVVLPVSPPVVVPPTASIGPTAAPAPTTRPDDQMVPVALWPAGPWTENLPATSSGPDTGPADAAVMTAEGPSTGRSVSVMGPPLGEVSERARAVALGESAPPGGELPTALDMEGAPVPAGDGTADRSSAASAHVVTRLAHRLRQASSTGDVARAEALRPAASDALAAVPADGQSPVRGIDVLPRFAPPGAGQSRAAAEAGGALPFGPGATTATVVPVLSEMSSTTTAAPTAAFSATAAALPPSAGDHVLQQVVSSLKMQWKDGIGEAKLHLRPDSLGAVSVSLRVEAGAVTAVVRADSPQVQEWVVQHQQTLRQQMEAAGLRLDDLVVAPDDHREGERQKHAAPEHRRRRQPAAPDTDAPTFDLML